MLQKQYRLKSRLAFKKALRGQAFCTSRYFVLFALPHHPQYAASGKAPRFGIIVSKKVDKRATRRNRIKRRLREAIRLTLLQSPLLEQTTRFQVIVIIARQAALEAPFQDIQAQLQHCFTSRSRAS